MKSIYIETSAVVSWLLGEPSAKKIVSTLNKAETVASSILTLIETERCLIRAEIKNILKPSDRQKLKGMLARYASCWALMEITHEVQSRAKEPFPLEPIRSLDALHLATILEFVKAFPDLYVLSNDRRILSNMDPLGVDCAII